MGIDESLDVARIYSVAAQLPLDTSLIRQGQRLMQAAMGQLNFSAKAYRRILNLARTISDLARCEEIQSMHLAEALQYSPKLLLS